MKWHLSWSRDYGVQYCEIIMQSFHKNSKSMSAIMEEHFFYPEKENESFYMLESDYKKLVEKVHKGAENKQDLEHELNKLKETGEKHLEFAKKTSKMNLSKISNKKLFELYKEFRKLWIEFTSYLDSTFYINEEISEKTAKIIESKKDILTQEENEKIIEYINTPSKESEIMKLNKKIKQIKEQELEELIDNYRWVPCLDLHQKPWDLEHLKEYYKNIQKENKNKKQIENPKKYFNNKEWDLITLNKKWTYVRDLRDEYRRKGMYYIRKLYGEIAKRMDLTQKQISYTTNNEIKNFLISGKKPDKKEIEKRISGFLMFSEGEIHCITEKIKEKAKEFGLEIKNENRLIGKTACKGIVKGFVKIIFTVKDLSKVKTGDILVSVTTGADYVPAMHRAAGIVTDEGGITCHAAIVSREMSKPCIVGTKNATKIFKDNDYVELNANQGTVKIIK